MRVLLLSLALAACAAPADVAPPAAGHNYLDGTTWVQTEPQAANPPTIAFGDSRASGFAGCNRFFAQVTHADGNALTFSGAGLTRMACPPEQMAVEQAFTDVLNRTRSAHYDRDALVLFDENEQQLARFERPR